MSINKILIKDNKKTLNSKRIYQTNSSKNLNYPPINKQIVNKKIIDNIYLKTSENFYNPNKPVFHLNTHNDNNNRNKTPLIKKTSNRKYKL